MTLQETLQKAQDDLGLSDQDFSDMFEISRRTVTRWRLGECKPGKIINDYVMRALHAV